MAGPAGASRPLRSGGINCLLVLALLLGCVPLLDGAALEDDSKFIGWGGETYRPGSGKREDGLWVEVVSWKPRAFVAHNFLSQEEARHLRKLAALTLRRSTVIGQGGKSVTDTYRTSYGTFLKRNSDPVVSTVDARVAHWVRIPVENAEDMQVLRYDVDQYYKKHFDGLLDSEAGPRVATVLLYLSDVKEGGETAFPDDSSWAHGDLPNRMGPFSKCTEGGVAFKPKLGDALLFWSIMPDGKTQDPASMHTGCPVIRGVKWTATKWIHAKAYRPADYAKSLQANGTEPRRDPGICADASDSCANWAKSGECEKNPDYMIGDHGTLGHCIKSCGRCTPCATGDLECYNNNRKALGYLPLLDVSPTSEYLF